MRKLISLLLLPIFLFGSISQSALYAVNTNGLASPWTREKATHLARSVLFYAGSGTIAALEQAGSASAAVNILFPDASGPDRTEFNTFINSYTSSGFSWANGTNMTRLYQLTYAIDPYEAKRKLFSLFEDIFPVDIDSGRDITYQDIYNQQSLIYANMLGNYEDMVKKLLYNNGGVGDYAEGDYLDLFNQTNPNNPNENYARELLQLFLMGEYEPFKSKDNGDTRNYEETDVKSLARILTGLRVDKTTRTISFDVNTHYSGATLPFLSGAANTTLPAYYDTASGTVNPTLILIPNAGNNGLTDNVIEYIFAKRSEQIALFLADRLYRFYVADAPTRAELDMVAQMILANNFDMLASVKQLLASDMMYSDKSMNMVRYKNPLELAIGTIKLLQGNILSNIVLDPNIYDTNLLRRLEWTPYYPGSVFGRDGFDDSNKWTSTSIQNTWMTATNYFSYRNGTGSVNFRTLLGNYRVELTNEVIPVLTSTKNTFTGSLTIISGTLDSNPPIQILSLQSLENTGATDSGSTDSGSVGTGSLIDTGALDTSSGSSTNSGSVDTGSTDSGSTNTGSTNTGSTDTTGTGSTGTGGTDTGNASTGSGGTDTNTGTTDTNSGSTNTGSTDTSSGSTNSGSTDTGSTDSGSMILSFTATGGTDTGTTLIAAAVFTNGVTPVSSGSVSLPNFRLVTDAGILTISGGTYDASTKTLTISSGSLSDSGVVTPIYSGSITFSATSNITADVLTADNLIDIFESYLLGDITLPSDVRDTLRTFLTTDELGNPILVTPTSTEYYDKKIRGLVSIILSQPEYVLLRGYDATTSIDTNTNHLLDSESSKLIFIELYGGNDYLGNVIPKDEYATYVNYRTSSSGSIALSGSDLTDLGGNYYMNTALAYGSGVGFKSLYDEGSLKLFNRVGTYRHSQDHDAAAKQMTSYNNTTFANAEGLFGHMVNMEYDGSHTESLGAKRPNIFRGGHYVNLGGSVILSNPMNGSIKYHMDTLESLVQARTYPGNTKNIFSDAGRISDIAKISVAAGGPSGANGDMNNVFRLTKILMDNNIGRTYYMGGYGGYDTHENQYPTLQKNLRFVSDAVTTFFNSVKGTQDVTIVIFSEFGRTNKMNGGVGTDHGGGGGMYVITSNPTLKSLLPDGTYGNLSFKDAKSNALGVGIDYRSVYGKIFEALYGLGGQSYFGDTTISLENDVSLTPNEVSLLSYSYQASGQNIVMNGELSVTGTNYDPGKAGYTRVLSGTGTNAMRNTSVTSGTSPQGYRYTFRLNSSNQPYFQIDSFSNQYTLTSVTGILTGATVPRILPGSTRQISQTGSSILPIFNNTSAPRVFVGTGVILESTGSSVIASSANPDFVLHFGSGPTQVTELTSSSGTLTWNGGFLLGENVDKNTFIPQNATITNSGITLTKNQVTRLVKVGADKLGVGMILNQSVQVEFRNITDTGSYRVLSSEDGVNWSDVEGSGQEYQRDASGSIIVSTNHFSYFALVASTTLPTVPAPSCTMSITPNTATDGTPVALSWNLVNAATGTLNPGNSTLNTATGTVNIIPPASSLTTYTITVNNAAGSANCNTSVLMTAPTNTGSTNTGSTNTGTTNTGTTNTGTTNTGSTNTGSTNTGSTNTGSTNTGSTNTGSTNTGVITPPVITVGPGGGGGGSSSFSSSTPIIVNKTKDTCPNGDSSGNAYDGSCGIVREKGSAVQVKQLNSIEVLLGSFLTLPDIIDDTAPEAKIEQYAHQAALKIWREVVKYPEQKDVLIEEVFNSLDQKLQDASRENTATLIAYILYDLQGFIERADGGETSEIGEVITSANTSTVRYVGADHALTLRSDMRVTKNTVITYLARNEAVQVLADLGKWSKIAYNGIEGYVKNSYLRDEKLADRIRSGQVPVSEGQKGTIQVDHSAYIRTGAGVQSSIRGVSSTGEEVVILDEVNGWFEIIWNGIRGYIAKWLVDIR